jgi:pimeloyl-ACP methyl ester carboxylesterase
MDALGHRRFAVAGHDTGMWIGYALAADHPDRVTRLAVAETPLPGVSPSPPLFASAHLNNALWHFAFNRLGLAQGAGGAAIWATLGASAELPAGVHLLPRPAPAGSVFRATTRHRAMATCWLMTGPRSSLPTNLGLAGAGSIWPPEWPPTPIR